MPVLVAWESEDLSKGVQGPGSSPGKKAGSRGQPTTTVLLPGHLGVGMFPRCQDLG